MERDNVTDALEGVGAVVLANACGPCIGQVCLHTQSYEMVVDLPVQWKRDDKKDEDNGA
jgi:homoaconitase